jgi:hypothetical protein
VKFPFFEVNQRNRSSSRETHRLEQNNTICAVAL